MGPMHRLVLTFLLVATCAGSDQGQVLQTVQRIEPFTRPSKDAMLALIRAGRVSEVAVEDGEYVKAGQLLIQLDDEAEKSQMVQARAAAENDVYIKAAKAELELKEVELEKVKKAALDGAVTELEVLAAEVAVKIEKLTMAKAKFEQEQSRLKYEDTKILVDRMRLTSPIDGRVEGIGVEAGEVAEAYEKIIRVVRIDPLWVDVPVPLAEAREKLTEGGTAKVAFTNSDGTVEYSDGRILKIASVADAASETLNVRVEVPNPSLRPAGEHVRVTFPPASGTGEAKQQQVPIGPQSEAKE